MIFIKLSLVFLTILNSYSENGALSRMREPGFLKELRLTKVRQKPEVKKLHQEFIKQTNTILDAPIEATPEKLTPYEDYKTRLRKKHPKQAQNGDVVDIICLNKELEEKEKKFLEERKQFAELLAKKERSARLISIISEIDHNWKKNMNKVAHTFTKVCGAEEKCLEQKQLHRQYQITTTATAHWNLEYAKELIPKVVTKDPELKNKLLQITQNAINKTEAEMHRIFDAVSSRKDLPW
jgi:flagellar motility protein MotE (MotC chaperone)